MSSEFSYPAILILLAKKQILKAPENNTLLVCSVAQSCPDSATPWTVACQAPLVRGDSPGKNIGVGCHALFQGIFPTQGLLESSSSSQGINLKRWIVSVRKMRQPLSFLGVPIYFKFKIIFYTFTKALGQRFGIFSFPSPKFIMSINHCCSSNRVSASVILRISLTIYYLLPLMCPIVNVITL